ncbi:hypothetical protein LCGC14_0527260 [marine sediment metagenome]|uniref:NTP pyrophosphohydrolase MazG putative catalytic core domain-containing protein n=1 Tax=marine sediment metagenome TaxID=412755 RepID=A0A0F9SF64_9ZZZZ
MEYIQGSMMDIENFEKLQKAKQYLDAIKSYKLELRHQKNIRKDWPKDSVMEHIRQEMDELEEGWKNLDTDNIIEELADLINCAEILAMMVLY